MDAQGPGIDGVELQVIQGDGLSLQPLGSLRLELDQWQYLAALALLPAGLRLWRMDRNPDDPVEADSPTKTQ
jgi:hypothetical protein